MERRSPARRVRSSRAPRDRRGAGSNAAVTLILGKIVEQAAAGPLDEVRVRLTNPARRRRGSRASLRNGGRWRVHVRDGRSRARRVERLEVLGVGYLPLRQRRSAVRDEHRGDDLPRCVSQPAGYEPVPSRPDAAPRQPIPPPQAGSGTSCRARASCRRTSPRSRWTADGASSRRARRSSRGGRVPSGRWARMFSTLILIQCPSQDLVGRGVAEVVLLAQLLGDALVRAGQAGRAS